MSFNSLDSTITHKYLSFASISLEDNGSVLTVRVSDAPYRYDIRIGLFTWFLPALVMFLVFSVEITFLQVDIAHEKISFWNAWRANSVFMLLSVLMLWPVVTRWFAMRQLPTYILDKKRNIVTRDGVRISSYKQIVAARIQQKAGLCGNLRLRLLLTTGTGEQFWLAESPLLETLEGNQHFVGGKPLLSPFSNDWRTFQNDKKFIDERDNQIFALAHEINEFLQTNVSEVSSS